jgi:murein DD-endopeptidase MepM/ murein hydrolase activator NlpD
MAGLIGRESFNNPNKPNTANVNNPAVGILQFTRVAVEDLNQITGFNLDLSDYDGENGVFNSIWGVSRRIRKHITDPSTRESVHMLANFHTYGLSKASSEPTEYSKCVVDNIEILRRALREREERKNNSTLAHIKPPTSSGFSNPLPEGYDYVRGVKLIGEQHHGHDLSAPEGKTIRAVRGGEVLVRGYQVQKSGPNKGKGWGNYLIINDGTYVWVYAHMKDRFVNKRDLIQQNQRIGTVGDTGAKGSFHLHIECWKISEWNRKGKGGKPVPKQLWP